MDINVTKNNEKTTIALIGKLDSTTYSKFQDILMAEFGNTMHIELNFSDLIYISSAGLRILLMGEKQAKKQGAKQTIINVNAEVMEVFEITGFANILKFE